MSEKLKTAVIEAISEVLKPQNHLEILGLIQQPDFKFADLTESSLNQVEICMIIEEKTGIEIELSDLLENDTFLKFLTFLEQQDSEK